MSYDLIIFISHQPLLNLNTGRWLVHPCRCCNESINWFFWSLIKCLNAYLSSSSAIFLSFYNFASLFLKLPRLLKTLKMVCSHFLFFFVQKFWSHLFCFFFCRHFQAYHEYNNEGLMSFVTQKFWFVMQIGWDWNLYGFMLTDPILFLLFLVLRMARKVIQRKTLRWFWINYSLRYTQNRSHPVFKKKFM